MKNNNVFTSYHWHNNSGGAQTVAISTKPHQDAEAYLNLHIKRNLGIRIAEMSGEPIIQYNDITNSNGEDASTFKKILLERLKQNNVDLLYFHNVRSDSNLFQQIKDIGEVIVHKQAPFINLTEFSSLDDFLKSLSPNTRKSKRRALKKLESAYQVSFEILIDGQISAGLFDQVMSLKKAQLTRMGLTSRLFESQTKITALKNIILKPNKDFQCIFSLLKCDGKIAAAEIGYLADGIYYSFLGAMDDEFSSSSPGSCQLLKTIEWALQNNVKIFDLLAPEDNYKFSWTIGRYAEVYDIILPLSLKGKLIGKPYLKTIRPLLKKAYLYLKAKK